MSFGASQPPIDDRRRRRSSLALALALAVVATCTVATQASAQGVTLDQYVDDVLSRGVAARVLAADIDAARAEVDAAGVWPNPRAEVSRQANAVGVRAGETQDQALVSIPLVLSGRLGLEKESAERDVAAAEARVAHARGALRHEATLAFLDVVAAQQRRQIHRASLEVLGEIVEAIRAREKAGDAAGYDRVRVELEVARLQSALAAAEADERAATARAAALWPADRGALVIAARDLQAPLPAPAAAAAAIALADRGDVRALVAEGEAARLAQDAAGRAWIPEPTLSGGGYLLDVIEGERGAGYVAAIEVPVPVFDHGQREGARARARAARAAAEHALLLHRAKVELDAARALVTASTERAKRHDADVLSRAHELLKTTTTAYRAGGMELLLLVDAERAAIEAEIASVDLRLDARRAENDLHLIAGSYDAPVGSER